MYVARPIPLQHSQPLGRSPNLGGAYNLGDVVAMIVGGLVLAGVGGAYIVRRAYPKKNWGWALGAAAAPAVTFFAVGKVVKARTKAREAEMAASGYDPWNQELTAEERQPVAIVP